MNILHLNRFFYSGQTTHVFALVREQQKQGIDSRLILGGYPTPQAVNQYQKIIQELDALLIRPGQTKKILSLLDRWLPDVIHAHSSSSFRLASSLADQLNVPLIITCHGLGLNTKEHLPHLENAKALICISPRVASPLRGFAHKIHIICNGVELEKFRPGEKGAQLTILFAARMDPGKQRGYNQLCKAVDLLHGVEFKVACNKTPLSKTARYLGWVSSMEKLLAGSHVVVGTGRTIIEGLAAGNAALILGRTYQGVLTPESVSRQKFVDLSGLSGKEPCYKDIFYDLAALQEDRSYLQSLQEFGLQMARKDYDNEKLTRSVINVYKGVLAKQA